MSHNRRARATDNSSDASPPSIALSVPRWEWGWGDFLGNKRYALAILLPLGTKVGEAEDVPSKDITICLDPSRRTFILTMKWPLSMFNSAKLLSHGLAFGDLFPFGCATQGSLATATKSLRKDFPNKVVVSTMTLELPFPCIFTPKDISGHEAIVYAKYDEKDKQKAALVLHVDLIEEHPEYPVIADTSAEADENEFEIG